jgi:hypothetical protein
MRLSQECKLNTALSRVQTGTAARVLGCCPVTLVATRGLGDIHCARRGRGSWDVGTYMRQREVAQQVCRVMP